MDFFIDIALRVFGMTAGVALYSWLLAYGSGAESPASSAERH